MRIDGDQNVCLQVGNSSRYAVEYTIFAVAPKKKVTRDQIWRA